MLLVSLVRAYMLHQKTTSGLGCLPKPGRGAYQRRKVEMHPLLCTVNPINTVAKMKRYPLKMKKKRSTTCGSGGLPSRGREHIKRRE